MNIFQKDVEIAFSPLAPESYVELLGVSFLCNYNVFAIVPRFMNDLIHTHYDKMCVLYPHLVSYCVMHNMIQQCISQASCAKL